MSAQERQTEQPLSVHWLGVAGPIPVSRWGKDHYSTLLYLETRAVDHGGYLPPSDPHMRADGHTYPTRLADGTEIIGHSDWECLADMQALGLLSYDKTASVPNVRKRSADSGVGVVELTDEGFRVAHETRVRKARTGWMLP